MTSEQHIERLQSEVRRLETLIKKMHMHLFPADAAESTGSGGGGVKISITGNGASVGVYTGSVADATGTIATGVTIYHEPERVLAPAANLLKTGQTYDGWYDSGALIAHIGVLPIGTTSSPATVGSNAEGSEAAEGTTWARTTDAKAVDVWMTSRVTYFDAGDKKLYGYVRKLSFDAAGLLIAISGETRYIIDTPETC